MLRDTVGGKATEASLVATSEKKREKKKIKGGKKERKRKKMEKWKARVRKNKNDDERRYKVPRWVENRKAIYAKLEASR